MPPLRVGLDLTCLEAVLETGVERYARRLAESLPKAAPEIVVRVLVREGKPAPAMPDAASVVAAPASFGRPLWREIVLPRVVRDLGLDVLHAPVAAVATLVSTPRVVTIHDVPDRARHAGEGGLFSRHRLRILHATAVADALITPSFATRDALVALDPRLSPRITVVPHGVDPDFRPAGPALNRARYGLPPGPYVLCVATVRPRKDHETLLTAFAACAASSTPGPFLVCAGKLEEDPAALLALAGRLGVRGRVHFPGYVAREDLPDLYREASVCVLPSRLEGFGMPLIEALASGTPVVGSDSASIPEVLGGAGLVFPAGDAAALAAALGRVLNEPALGADLRARGLRRASGFTWEASARRHAAVYAAVAEARRR